MPSIEALWTVDFDTASGWVNAGIVVLETGRIFGGDSQFYYLGHYALDRQEISGTARVTQYIRGQFPTAWGDNAQDFEVTLRGAILDPLPGTTNVRMEGQMHRQGYPSLGVRM